MNDIQMKPMIQQGGSPSHYDVKNIVIAVLVFVIIVETVFLFLPKGGEAPGVQEEQSALPSGENMAVKTFAGIETDSSSYQEYASCVSACGLCPTACEQNLLRAAALEKRDVSYCDQVAEGERQNCADELQEQIALEGNDAASCEKLSTEDLQLDCKLRVGLTKAIETSDVSACADLPEEHRIACEQPYYREMAIRNHDASLCARLLDPNEQAACQEDVRQQPEAES